MSSEGNEPAGKSQDDGSNSSSSDESTGTGDILLSLRDPTYCHVMQQYFIKLGTRSNPNNPDYTEAKAAQEVFDMFKNKNGRFLKPKNPRKLDHGFMEVDDDDALSKIHRDMDRRMESAKRWLESKSPDKKKPGSPVKKNKSPRNPTNLSIIISLSDPTYREVMHKFFKKMGPKKKIADETKPTDAEEAVVIVKEFRRMMGSGKFMKRENWRDSSSELVEVEDDEARKRIKMDLTRRNDSIKEWMGPKPSSSAKKPSKPPLRTEDDSDDDSDSPEPTPRSLRKKKPLNYANSGAEIESKTAKQVEAERTAKQTLSRKKKKKEPESSESEDSDDDSDSPKPTPRSLRKKQVLNYANSGAEIESKTAKEVEAERTAAQTLSAKTSPKKEVSTPQLGVYLYDNSKRVFYDLNGRETKFRENDTVLTLRDAHYRDTLLPFFIRLGTTQDIEENKNAANEAYEVFKKKGGRFFKPNGRGKDADCDQIDEYSAKQNMYLDIKRRTDTTWWIDKKGAASLSTKQPSSAVKKVKKKKPTRIIIVSLSDPDYRDIMEVEFKKLGAKYGPDKREVTIAREVFDRLKKDGAVFYKLENFRDADSEHIEMDDDEAFKKIRTDLQRRMESAKRWLDGGVNSKSYADTKHAIPQKEPPSHKSSKKTRSEISKKREMPHRPSPPKKKARTDSSLSGSDISRHSDGIRRSSRMVTGSPSRGSNAMRVHGGSRPRQGAGNAPKVTICFGDHIIDTASDPSVIQPSQSHLLGSLPDRFDPNVRPSVPALSGQIYIPGNEVYARWLNEDDPSSYGTWYPGYVHSSKLANTNVPGGDMPKLLYHVKYHDGAEGIDLHTEDLMMREQYEAWLRALEMYYALPQLGDSFRTLIPKGARVYAQWNDPTDPDAHGSWLQGTVRETNGSRRYHIRFDNGDEDDDMSADHVLLDGVYAQLLAEKMKNGSDPIIATDIRGSSTSARSVTQLDRSRTSAPSINQRAQKPATLKFTCEIAREDLDISSNDSLLEELRCDEVLASVKPVAKTQGIHYGIYIEAKHWRDVPQLETIAPMEVDNPSKCNTESNDVSMDELRCEETLV